MGKNNRARRQQKQRQKEKKHKQGFGSLARSDVLADEIIALCQPLVTSLSEGEPPPPAVMDRWTTCPGSNAVRSLHSLLLGFAHFIFSQDSAEGQLDHLIPYKEHMKQAGLSWLYALLYAYCLVSHSAQLECEVDTLTKRIDKAPIPSNIPPEAKEDAKHVLYAPLFLTLWAMGRSIGDVKQLRLWLEAWLWQSSTMGLLLPLNKFLRLKQPKPSQKTVGALESALASVDLNETDEWYKALSALLSLFLRTRLSSKQISANWQAQCPTLAHLAGLGETTQIPDTSQLDFSDANTATLRRLQRSVNLDAMPYIEQVSFEALKCRILSKYADDDLHSKEYFDQQLERVVHLLSISVPPEHRIFAEQCLASLCEWLAEVVGAGHVPPPAAMRMRHLARLRPDDYRVALLSFLTRARQSSRPEEAVQTNFQQIHFPLFFLALRGDTVTDNTLVDRFFWPLTGEAKKALFTQSCQRLFLSMNEEAAEHVWTRRQTQLFNANKAPFDAIIKGQSCEAELLFYVTIAAVETDYGIDWLQPDQLAPLIRSAQQLLRSKPSRANRSRMITLLNTLATHAQASRLFQDWESIIALLQRIHHLNSKLFSELEAFLRLALITFNQQAGDEENKAALYELCKSLPKLKQYMEHTSHPQPTPENKKPSTLLKKKLLPIFEFFGNH